MYIIVDSWCGQNLGEMHPNVDVTFSATFKNTNIDSRTFKAM